MVFAFFVWWFGVFFLVIVGFGFVPPSAILRVIKYRNRSPREAVESPSSQIHKTQLSKPEQPAVVRLALSRDLV